MMRHLAGSCALLAMLFHLLPAAAQDNPPQAGRWVKTGTYALSGFAANPDREDTYRGASKEGSRVLSFLPAMTIIFPNPAGPDSASLMKGYVSGITQTGTPVLVIEKQLSKGTFSNTDVVIHTEHKACPEAFCDLAIDGRSVGSGQSYMILESELENLVHLYNATSEANFYYRTEQFNQLERRGTLTQLKDKIIPRWDIREGYAKELSLGCGGEHKEGTKFTVDAKDYESSPDTWALNGPQWNVKGADLFVGSNVEKSGDTYTAEITRKIHDVTKTADAGDDYKSAIDFTVFAYRDRNNPPSDNPADDYQFAVLISIVACTKKIYGDFAPDYVRQAHLYFEDDTYELPQQMEEKGKQILSDQIDRSFMYSVNTPDQYERLFERLAAGLGVEYSDVRSNLVAVVMARLNATCSSDRRGVCAKIVDDETVKTAAIGQ
jgi:hypothetical protein